MPRRLRTTNLGRVFLIACCLFGALASVRAQGPSYCNITGITTQTLANAVQITIRADGLMDVQWDINAFFDLEGYARGGLDQVWRPVTVLPFRIANARSRVGPFTDISVYPASHVEVSIPPDARDGIGLDLRVVLFRPATPIAVETPYGVNISDREVGGPTVFIKLTPDRTRLAILVTSDRQVFRADERRALQPGAPVRLDVSAEGDEVSIEALNADIRDVIREISRRTGRDVVADGVLEKTVSLSMPLTPVEQALDALAFACGLTLYRSGNAIQAADGRANSLPAYVHGAFETVPLRHITAASARNGLPDALLRYLHLDEAQNALTVSGPLPIIQKVQADLAVLDRPVSQVAIEALIVEFTETGERDRLLRLGQAWDDGRLTLDTGTGDIVFDAAGPLTDQFTARLNALVQSGQASIRARPRAVVRSGDTAKLFVGQQKYIKVAEYNALEGADIVRIMAVNLGVTLSVTPYTGDGRELIVDIAPELSTIAEREPRTGLPTVFTRSAKATLHLRSGDTAVIGGLVDHQAERRRRRVPVLGDLPLIGRLFHYTEARQARRELVLFVNARVLEAADDGLASPAPTFGGVK